MECDGIYVSLIQKFSLGVLTRVYVYTYMNIVIQFYLRVYKISKLTVGRDQFVNVYPCIFIYEMVGVSRYLLLQ